MTKIVITLLHSMCIKKSINPTMIMIRITFLAFLSLFSGILFAQTNELTTVILVRHAEKGFDEAGDPDLTEEGTNRAIELKRILHNQHFDAIYSTPFKRTRQTVAPLAAVKNLEVLDYNPFKMDEVMDIINSAKGKTILFSGHSNTTPVIINKIIGSEEYKSMSESDYDNIYIVTFSAIGQAKVIELEYGAHSEITD